MAETDRRRGSIERRHLLGGGLALVGGALVPRDALACHTYVSPVDGRVGCGFFRRDAADGVSPQPPSSPPQSGGGTTTPPPSPDPAPGAGVRIGKAGNLKYELSPGHSPVATVSPGQTFEVELEINCGPGLIRSTAQTSLSRTAWDARPKNPVTGPIHIAGAKPGQVVTVHIKAIRPVGLGYTGIHPGAGLFPNWVPAAAAAFPIKVVSLAGGRINWRPGYSFPMEPLIGTIGVAPASGTVPTVDLASCGGNLDMQEARVGNKISFVVNRPGAYLYFGDTHAIQGDGESCVIGGIECASVVQLAVTLGPRPPEMVYPRIETPTHIGVVAMKREPMIDAAREAFLQMIAWLQRSYGFGRDEAYMFLSQVAEARSSLFVGKTHNYICKVRKDILPPRVA